MSYEPTFVAETLDWCNEVRGEKGMEPLPRLPKGRREDPVSCPCGQATGLWVESPDFFDQEDVDSYANDLDHLREEGLAFVLPDAVQEFVSAFDKGELPQYEETVFGIETGNAP